MKNPLFTIVLSLALGLTLSCGRKGLRDALGESGGGTAGANNSTGVSRGIVNPLFNVPEFTLSNGSTVSGFNPGVLTAEGLPQFFGAFFVPSSGSSFVNPSNLILKSFSSDPTAGFAFDAAGLRLYGNGGNVPHRFGTTHILHFSNAPTTFPRAGKIYAGGRFVVGPASGSRVGFTLSEETQTVSAQVPSPWINPANDDDDKVACDLYRDGSGVVHARVHYSLGTGPYNYYVIPLAKTGLPTNPVGTGNAEVQLECALIRHVVVMYVNQRLAGIAARLGNEPEDPRINPFFNNFFDPSIANEGYGFQSRGADNYVKAVAIANLDAVVDPPIFAERFQSVAGASLATAPSFNGYLYDVSGTPLVLSAPGRLVSSQPGLQNPTTVELSNVNLDETDINLEFDLAGSAGEVGIAARRLSSPNGLHGYYARVKYGAGNAQLSLHLWNNGSLGDALLSSAPIPLGSNTAGAVRIRIRDPYRATNSPNQGHGEGFELAASIEVRGLIGGTAVALQNYNHVFGTGETMYRHGKVGFLLGGSAAVKSYVIRVPEVLPKN